MIRCQACSTRHREPMCEEKVLVAVRPSMHPKKVRFNPHLKHGRVGRAQAIRDRIQKAAATQNALERAAAAKEVTQ
jgi:hypothetical protein